MEADTFKLIAQYGIGGFLALVLGRVMWMIGNRMIASIDSLGTKWEASSQKISDRFDAHTKADVEALGGLSRAVEHLDGKFDAVLDSLERTPINQPIPQPPEPPKPRTGQTPAAGSPTTYSQHSQYKRGRTNG